MGAYTGLTRAQQRMLDQVKAEGEITLNGHGLRTARILAARGSLVLDEDTSTVRPRCATLGCKRAATELISYTYRSPVPSDLEHEAEVDTELACKPCADGYARRPVLKGLVRRPAVAGWPMLQVLRESWTASVNSRSIWRDLRPATRDEIIFAADKPGGQFWLDGEDFYYQPVARSNAHQCVRVVRTRS